jgi:hypothetical protein
VGLTHEEPEERREEAVGRTTRGGISQAPAGDAGDPQIYTGMYKFGDATGAWRLVDLRTSYMIYIYI